MRRKDREILQKAQIAELIGRCQTVRMGMFGDDFPYIVPLTFGFEMCGERLVVYFHCAAEGKKLDLLARDERVCLEWDILHGYAEVRNALMAEYESAIAFGRAQRCEGAERVKGLRLLLEHTGFSDHSPEQCADLPAVEVYRVECDRVTGKRCDPFKGKE